MTRYAIRKLANGYKFDLRSANGRIVAVSEGYTTMASCRLGIASVRKYAPVAEVQDLTCEKPAKVTCPKYEVYKDRRGEYRFRLRARNGKIIAASEGYTTKESCLGGIESVRCGAFYAEIVNEG